MLPLNVPLSQVSDPQEGVLLLVDKPLTWTSFDVVNKIRYYLKKELKTGKIKVGHAGTLDPLATGLLIICIGKYTKRIEEIQTQNKEYKGTMILGSTTPSYDLETEADNTFPISDLHEEELLKTVLKFEGEIEQIPPAYSAVKVDGVRAYKKARDNQSIKLKSRTVNIETF
ncbi:MAG: tRNA pseudouridine(55) synthase, partial [Flavobacteriales bacterium]|nr:tRNA pseudouridine(55) synthase [Flavobacteriales bacterium]